METYTVTFTRAEMDLIWSAANAEWIRYERLRLKGSMQDCDAIMRKVDTLAIDPDERTKDEC